MEKIHVSFTKDLRNREFSLLIDNVCEILVNSKCKNTSLIKATRNLQSHYKELLQLKDSKPRHYLTRIINEKVHNRTEYLACLRMSIESALLSPDPQKRIAANRLLYWIDPYRKTLFKPSLTVQTQAVEFINLDKSDSATIQKHTALLDIDYILDTVVAVTEEIKEHITERGKDKVDKATNGKKVREATYNDLKVVLNLMQSLYDLSDDSQEVDEMVRLSLQINHYLTSFRKELRSRNTKRKNKKEDEASVNQLLQQEEKQDKLAFIAYNDLRIDNTKESPTTNTPQQKTISTFLSLKDKHVSNKTFPFINSDNKKGGNGKLPPVNSN